MARWLPSLNALRAFEAAARHVSFSLAAAEMNVSHAAVSRHIRDLEMRLGVKLFHRTGRGVELTETGVELANELTPAFDLLSDATKRFLTDSNHQRLVINSEVSFAAMWLVPRLGRFTALHPNIELVIDPTNRLVDFSRNEADLGIRYGSGHWPGVDAARLVTSQVTLVCSPKRLKKQPISSPAELPSRELIQEDTREFWSVWLAEAGAPPGLVPGGPTYKGHLAIAAAEAGQGFALADTIQAGDALLERRLVRPFAITVSQQSYYLVSGTGRKPRASAKAFKAWLTRELTEFESMFAALNAKQR